MTTNSIDAARLRKWAAQIWPTGLQELRAEIAAAAAQLEADEAAFDADMEAECQAFERLFPPLDDEIPTVLPVQPVASHEFGCGCPSCCRAVAVLDESARTGEACGIVYRKEGVA